MPRLAPLGPTVLVLLAVGVAPAGVAAARARQSGPLVITEVLVNSGLGSEEAAGEWLEIWNDSDHAVTLDGWQIEDNHAADRLPPIALPPDGLALLTPDPARWAAYPLPANVVIVPIEDGRIGNGLANSGDRLLLLDPNGSAVDGLSWGTDRSIMSLSSPADGESLSRSEAGAPFQVGVPSPGERGLPAPPPPASAARLRISEIFGNAGQGTADSAYEWIEILNPGDEPVEIGGWRLSDNAGTDILPNAIVPPGGYLVIAAMPANVAAAATVVGVPDGRIGNGLSNSGDVVTLADASGTVIDSVEYRSPPLPLPEAGRSIALRDGVWVVNIAPSPGGAAVEPLLATLATEATDPPGNSAPVQEEQDGSGIPAWMVIAVALGVPGLLGAGRWAWLRRGRWAWLRRGRVR